MKKKLLILIVAFNHEKFIKKVLNRIDENLINTYDVEILINDDSSSDETVKVTADVKPKRARNTKGQLKADDPSTPDVNEAWESGEAPVKTTKKTTTKKTTKKKS